MDEMAVGSLSVRMNGRMLQRVMAHKSQRKQMEAMHRDALLAHMHLGLACAGAGVPERKVYTLGDFRGKFPPGEIEVERYSPWLIGMIGDKIGASPNVSDPILNIMINLMVNGSSGVVRAGKEYNEDEKAFCEAQIGRYIEQIPVISLKFSPSDGTNLGNFTNSRSGQYTIGGLSQLATIPFWHNPERFHIAYIGDPSAMIDVDKNNALGVRTREDIEKKVSRCMDRKDLVLIGNGPDKPVEVYRIRK